MVRLPNEYKKGFLKFLNCKIDLSKRVFIPRIETEYWVKKAMASLNVQNKKLKVLDIFAGSGCIGIAILKNIKNSSVDFVDIDKKAIAQIKINLKLNKISSKRVKVFQLNLFEGFKKKKYDIIFANPPYVAKERKNEIGASVLKYEPRVALLAGKGGLIYIKKFLKLAKKFLEKSGIIYLEFDPKQRKDIKNILKEYNYKNFKFSKDQFEKYRWLKIIKDF